MSNNEVVLVRVTFVSFNIQHSLFDILRFIPRFRSVSRDWLPFFYLYSFGNVKIVSPWMSRRPPGVRKPTSQAIPKQQPTLIAG